MTKDLRHRPLGAPPRRGLAEGAADDVKTVRGGLGSDRGAGNPITVMGLGWIAHGSVMRPDGTAAVDGHGGAVFLQLGDLRSVVDQKALEQERRFQPGAIQFSHEHALFDLSGGDGFLHVYRQRMRGW